jgi:hypothetical protein
MFVSSLGSDIFCYVVIEKSPDSAVNTCPLFMQWWGIRMCGCNTSYVLLSTVELPSLLDFSEVLLKTVGQDEPC